LLDSEALVAGNLLLFLDKTLLPLVFERAWDDDLTVLLDGVVEFTLDLDLGEGFLDGSSAVDVENASCVFVIKVAFPEAPCLSVELISAPQVPVLGVTIELKVVLGVHAVDSHDTVVTLHRHIFDCSDSIWHHLLQVVHLIYVLLLVPQTGGFVDEDQVLVLVVDHFGNVVKVHVLEENKDLKHVAGVHRSSKATLTTVLHIHVLAVITVSVFFDAPSGTILELLGNIPPVPVVSNPVRAWCTITSVHLEDVEGRGSTEHNCGHSLPEAGPFDDATVLVDNLTLLEGEICIRLHGRCLNEGLQLVARVSWSALNTENALNRLFLQNWVSETVGNVGELLLIGPLDVVFGALVVIVVGSCGTVLELLLEVELHGLREPGACWLSPAVVVLEESVVKVGVELLCALNLVETFGHVRHVLEIVGADLSDVQVDHECVVAVQLPFLVSCQASRVKVTSLGDVFVGKDARWLAELVTRCLHICEGQILLTL
jgi:hypothetical protein